MISRYMYTAGAVTGAPLGIFKRSLMVCMLFCIAMLQPTVLAITISMEYSDEGDPLPHDENPSWDPDGSILKSHFEAAKLIWERLLPGEETYSFDFHWDDDIDGLGLTTDTPLDTYIEIHPNRDWFVDPTPGDHSEFNLTSAQTLFNQLSPGDQATYFPGTAPPSVLEVGFRGTGVAGPVGVAGFHAQNGRDLFSTVLHEIGHVLGISGIEPGDYNMLPEHVGGLFNVLVLEGDGGHLAGQGAVPVLMCESCGATGVRRFPSATDILVIAEDQGISDVHLDRVDRVASGLWNNTYGWIGGDVPDATQDVTIRQGGPVTLDVDADVRNLIVHTGSTLIVGPHRLTAADTLNFRTTPIAIDSTGIIAADTIIADPAVFLTVEGARMQFNQFLQAQSSSATSFNFDGDIEIGYATETPGPVSFDPATFATWDIDGSLTVGQARGATLLIQNDAWDVFRDVTVGGGAEASHIDIGAGGALSVGDDIYVHHNGQITYRASARADSDAVYELQGGETQLVDAAPPGADYLKYIPAGRMAFEEGAGAQGATFNVGGGAGSNGPQALLTFRGFSMADDAKINNRGGRSGQALPYYETKAGLGGETRFEGSARAIRAHIRNEGSGNDDGGTGGRTVFAGNSNAEDATIENIGSEWTLHYTEYTGGRTEFFDSASAGDATIINAIGPASFGVSAGGHTIFRGQSTAATAEIFNLSGTQAFGDSGETHFRDASNAGDADIVNGGSTVNRTFGTTRFYETSSAANADITLRFGSGGGGQAEFNGNSTAGDADIIFEGAPPAPANGWGGRVYFNDNSSAGTANFVIQPEVRYSVLWFDDESTAGDATFVAHDRSGATIDFFGHSDMGTADFDLGRNGRLWISGDASAANAEITVRGGASGTARGYAAAGGGPTVSLGAAQIHVLGATEPLINGIYGGHFGLEHNATGGTANIVVEGGTVPNAYGGTFNVDFGSLEAATLTLNGGVPGAFGGSASFTRGGDGVNARVISNAGTRIDVVSRADDYGDTEIGFITGAGALGIADLAHLIVGGLDDDMTLSGPITTVSGWGSNGGQLTKEGDGTLTLSGTNTYRGLTTVNEGTLMFNGSMPGDIVVNAGGTLKGGGVVGGSIAISAGAQLAPGASAGTMTVGGLQLSSGSVLDFQIGAVSDRILVTGPGNVTLGGVLDISLVPGFTPTLGQSFPLLGGAVGSIGGAFQSIIAPVFNGLTFQLLQSPSSAVLQVVAATAPTGDFNGDGSVDSNDLVDWKGDFGVNGDSDADGDGDTDGNDFLAWQRQLGQRAATVATSATVPESTSLTLVGIAILCLACRSRPSRS